MPTRWVVRTVLALASVALLAFVVLSTARDPFGRVDRPPRPRPPSTSAPPCEWLSDLELEQLAERWWARVEAGLRNEPLAEAEQAIEVRVEEAFAPVYEHIPEFLDWHYSIAGQYTQLAAVIVTLLQEWGFPRTLAERLARSESTRAVLDRLREWEPTRALLERLARLELPASAREQLDRFQQQVGRAAVRGPVRPRRAGVRRGRAGDENRDARHHRPADTGRDGSVPGRRARSGRRTVFGCRDGRGRDGLRAHAGGRLSLRPSSGSPPPPLRPASSPSPRASAVRPRPERS